MKPLLCIVGPTASGKSGLALQLCAQIGGEIVSCDSMQIYRGCDIATAKPTPQERAQIPHHLLDLCDPNERFSAAQWAHAAREVIENIEKRGKTPIVCGGTGFYLRALLFPETLASIAPDETLRADLAAELEATDAAQMHQKLAKIDPRAAARLHPNDSFRVLRALEIALSQPVKTATPVEAVKPEFSPLIFGLDWPRETLYARINSRVDAMIDAGFDAELRILVEKWGRDAPALGGVGYKQMLPVEAGEIAREAGIELWKRETRRYAKRQMTWFRHQLEVSWLDGARERDELAAEIIAVWKITRFRALCAPTI